MYQSYSSKLEVFIKRHLYISLCWYDRSDYSVSLYYFSSSFSVIVNDTRTTVQLIKSPDMNIYTVMWMARAFLGNDL
jgi:hypothetical protein